MRTMTTVEFCGESYLISPVEPLLIGRECELTIEENPYLHRMFLQIADADALWWLSNVGSTLTATIADEHGLMQVWLTPGSRLPVVFERKIVWFAAGSTTRDDLHLLDSSSLPLGLKDDDE